MVRGGPAVLYNFIYSQLYRVRTMCRKLRFCAVSYQLHIILATERIMAGNVCGEIYRPGRFLSIWRLNAASRGRNDAARSSGDQQSHRQSRIEACIYRCTALTIHRWRCAQQCLLTIEHAIFMSLDISLQTNAEIYATKFAIIYYIFYDRAVYQ